MDITFYVIVVYIIHLLRTLLLLLNVSQKYISYDFIGNIFTLIKRSIISLLLFADNATEIETWEGERKSKWESERESKKGWEKEGERERKKDVKK